MAALVQSFPQHSSTVTMLQTRPSSASGTFQSSSPGQHLQGSRPSQMSRSIYNATVGGMATSSYRGHTSLAPVAPYAFTSTPGLTNGGNLLRPNPATPHLRQDNRTSSASVTSNNNSPGQGGGAIRPRYPASTSICTSSSSSSSNGPTAGQQAPSRDDPSGVTTARSGEAASRPASTINLVSSNTLLPPPALAAPGKSAPDRYRRTQRRGEAHTPVSSIQQPGLHGGSAFPSGSGMASVGHLYQHPTQSTSSPSLSTYQPYRRSPSPLGTTSTGFSNTGPGGVVSVDDMNFTRQPTSEQAKRSHRRSLGSFDAANNAGMAEDLKNYTLYESKLGLTNGPHASRQDQNAMLGHSVTPPQAFPHSRNGSGDSVVSAAPYARPSSATREAKMGDVSPTATALHSTPVMKHEAKLVNIPPRGASDPSKRLTTPSPLSKPTDMRPQSPSVKDSMPSSPQPKPTEASMLSPNANTTSTTAGLTESPAAQQLAALNKKEGKKEGKSSRLRRAFSFGSAAELRRASAENNLNNNLSVERAKLRKERYHDEREAEQAAIAQKQEAAGLGEGIYSGQGHFFTGSTDNLSISSTASSASVMIRKMGKGMKKSTRSLVGLFRPKSVVGVPAADAALPEPSLAQVSMVTVEAEREKVNVNVDPHDQVGGGTGFPKLERNSLDTAGVGLIEPPSTDDRRSSESAQPRRSMVGGEKERAEVLAAVKKGILKRGGNESGNSSPVVRPIDTKTHDFNLPQIPHVNDTPGSSAPSTPGDDHPARLGHRRTDPIAIEGEDYFMSIAKFANGDTKSLPGTPRSIASRNISFSPRIQFHDTWPSGEYDRRGEIATCNRLTPVLAQQIKEELNTFKMEMEVHEQSKVYTHFF